MYHFIYKVTCPSGKYYIGRHSTKNIDDGYVGSGKWIRSLKDRSKLKREILEFCDENNIKFKEKQYLNEFVGKENCMNFNLSPVGFSYGELNPSKDKEIVAKRSLKLIGENNPTKREEVRKKMSESQKNSTKNTHNKGKKLSDEARKNMSQARNGLKFSEQGKRKLSESRKKQYQSGERQMPNFTGKKHSEETIQKMKLAREKYWAEKRNNKT
jgi:hypothetical protein